MLYFFIGRIDMRLGTRALDSILQIRASGLPFGDLDVNDNRIFNGIFTKKREIGLKRKI